LPLLFKGSSPNFGQTERGQMPLPPNTVTIGNLLQKEGYRTAATGK